MQNLMNDLTKLFQKDERIYTDGKLLKNKLTELALKLDQPLIDLLLSDEKAKKHFFVEKNLKQEKVLVFDKDKFIAFVNNKEFLPDSYTSFTNKIGLMKNNDYIKERRGVVLAWAYKDCVLEGGQDKEDQKRDEIFYNETLSPDEIDRLFEPKVLTNFKKYDSKGEHKVEAFNTSDNLIIKGNNLLALYCLINKYRGKIKLIYIDPPYNTGNDSFHYNNSFNHSTWLTFMKNRLEVAHSLLSDDGFIFIQCDDYENAYLKILMDEVFGQENYRNSIYWHRTYAGKTVSKNLPWNVDTILLYSKKETTSLKPITSELTQKDIDSFNKDDKDGRGLYNTVSLQKTGGPGPETTYDYIDNSGQIWKCPLKGWRMKKEKLKALENDNRLYITHKTIREKYYLKERLEIGKQIDNFWGDVGNMNRSSDIDYGLGGQKPEQLIKRFIDLTISQGDIVLDFFLGSGTTVSVAHKMGCQYIGVEQLDYGENDSVNRIQNVIRGDKSGVSEAIGWEGGGSFIYCELKQWNEAYIKEVKEADTSSKLLNIYKRMEKEAFFRYEVDLSTFEEKEFGKLSLEEQRQVLCECLDKNHLYVNLGEIDDATYKISEEDKKLNKDFYKTTT